MEPENEGNVLFLVTNIRAYLVYTLHAKKKHLKKERMEFQKAIKQSRNDTTILLQIVIPICFDSFLTKSRGACCMG